MCILFILYSKQWDETEKYAHLNLLALVHILSIFVICLLHLLVGYSSDTTLDIKLKFSAFLTFSSVEAS